MNHTKNVNWKEINKRVDYLLEEMTMDEIEELYYMVETDYSSITLKEAAPMIIEDAIIEGLI